MADVFSKRKRSEVMSRIRGRGNKDTELALAKLLLRQGITGWRRHIEIRGRAVLPRGPNFKAARQHRPTSAPPSADDGPLPNAHRLRLCPLKGRVHLSLWVKVKEGWRDDPSLLRLIGLPVP